MSLRPVGAGIAGGLLAGAAVGLVEALISWFGAHGAGELPAIGWALVVYGLVGAAGGLGAGILAALLRSDGFGLALGGVGAALTFVVARFRIIRDVFLEQLPQGALTTVLQAVGALAAVVLAVLVWRLLRGADARRRWPTRPLAAAALVAVLALAWTLAARMVPHAAPPAPPARAAAPPNAPSILLIMVDTLRADHLSSYGYGAGRTPNIDSLATDGVRCAHTFSQASWTRPSVATILTSLYPSSHGAVHKADMLPDRVDTVAEVLSRGGYYTAGFADNVNVSPSFNFGQGFADYRYLAPDLFFHANEPAAQLTLYSGLRLVRERFLARRVDVHNYYQPAEVVTDTVIGWLDSPAAKQGPFFLFAHYMDPHDPYFVHPFNGEGYARVANPNPPASVADKYRQLYDGEIAYLDEHLGRLFADLKRRGLYDKMLIVLTGDHGEEFHEHGGWWHGTTLYDEQIHVPLILKPPAGGARGRRDRRAHDQPRHHAHDPRDRGARGAAGHAGASAAARQRHGAGARQRVLGGGLRGQRAPVGAHAVVEADHRESRQPARPATRGALRPEDRPRGAAQPGLDGADAARGAAGGARPVLSRGAGPCGRRGADRRRQRHQGPPAGPRLPEVTHVP